MGLKFMCSRHDAQYQDYICQIPMWNILEKSWSKFNALFKLQGYINSVQVSGKAYEIVIISFVRPAQLLQMLMILY